MEILILSWRDPKHPLAGGAEQVVHEHAKGWVEAGYRVTYFSSYSGKGRRKEKIDKIHVLRYGNQLLGVHIAAFFWYLFCPHPRFDLVLDNFHGIPFFTPLYIQSKKLALLHETTREVWLSNQLPRPLNFLVGRLGYLLEPFFFVLYKNIKFITASNSAMKDLTVFGIPKSNISVIPNGLILSKQSSTFQRSDPILNQFPSDNTASTKILPGKIAIPIIFLGALAKDKGIEDAIKTFSLLNRLNKKVNLIFWVVGRSSNKYLRYLKKLAVGLGLQNKVKFFGFVSQKKKFQLLEKSYLLINPSIREGWGLVNIEANSVGIPVVAYRSPGLIDSVKHGFSGVICKQNTPLCLAKTIIAILKNKKRYSRLQKGAYLWSKNFSWTRSRKISLDLIKEITNEK